MLLLGSLDRFQVFLGAFGKTPPGACNDILQWAPLIAVLVKPFFYEEWELAATFSVGRETTWLYRRRAAALALPMVGPDLGFLEASLHSINGKVSDTPNSQGLRPSMQHLGKAVQGESC